MDARLILIGLLVGLLVGATGVGGSALMTPLLILALRINPLVAVGTDLAYSVPTRLLGAYVHGRQGNVDVRTVRALCLGGVPAAVAGLVTVVALRSWVGVTRLSAFTKHGVGVLLFVSATAMILAPLLTRLRKEGRARRKARRWTPGVQARVVALGAFVGFVVALTSIGAGSLTVPALYLMIPWMGLRRLVGVDVTFAAVLVPTAAIGHLGLGDVNLPISANLLVGSLPGVYVGSKLCASLPEVWLRPAIAGVMVWAGISLV